MDWWILGAVVSLFVLLLLWRSYNHSPSAKEHEIKYYESINNYITSKGFYEPLLQLQGTDLEYCTASLKVYKAGYLAGQSEKLVGALTMDSVKQYQQNRELAILFLQAVENQFHEKSETKVNHQD